MIHRPGAPVRVVFLICGALIVALGIVASASAAPVPLATFGNFAHPSGIAVNEADGNVFVADGGSSNDVRVFGSLGGEPAGLSEPFSIAGFAFNNEPSGVAVAADGSLYVANVAGAAVAKYELGPSGQYEFDSNLSAAPPIGEPLDVEVGPSGDIYVADFAAAAVIVFDSSGAEVARIDVSGSVERPSSVALDAAGDLFVQGYSNGKVFEYGANSSGEIEAGTVPVELVAAGATGVAVDASAGLLYVAMGDRVEVREVAGFGLVETLGKGELSATERVAVDSSTERVYVADAGAGDVAVFGPLPPPTAPEVLSESAVATPAEAELRARLFSGNEEATYRFEFGPTAAYGFSTPTKTIPASAQATNVVGHALGLAPGTTYHYRAVVENAVAPAVGSDRTFTTPTSTGNGLPDGRAYELVTPADTNGVFIGTQLEADVFQTIQANGSSVLFNTHGVLPGLEGNGVVDSYEAVRSETGWETRAVEPNGAQAVAVAQGGTSNDHGYSFWEVGSFGGTLDRSKGDPFLSTHYLREPDGSFSLVGTGSLGIDIGARGRWISPGGGHVIFESDPNNGGVQLEPNAPPSGVAAIYDRGPTGPTDVVSLLPGEVTPTSSASFQGASEDGEIVAFTVEEVLYARIDDEKTVEIAPPGATFEGIFGGRVFYLSEGDVFAYDSASGVTIPIGSGGASTVVNISEDGSHVYFSSPLHLDGSKGSPGAPNLYSWDGGSPEFVATLDPSDFSEFGGSGLVNLGMWAVGVGPTQNALVGRANDPSRTTPDGSVLVFESHAVSGYPYDSGGHAEIYRYRSGSPGVNCISCLPSGEPAETETELEATGNTVQNAPTTSVSRIANVTTDGDTVFFQTGDALVSGDTDGVRDVYEWHEGNLGLISSGRSALPNFLFGMSPDGHDVFFKTSDALVPEDETGGSGSIYDARIDGGFGGGAVSPPACSVDSCQGPGSPAPARATPASDSFAGPGSPKPRRHRRHKSSHPGSHGSRKHGKHRGTKGGSRHGRGGSKGKGNAR